MSFMSSFVLRRVYKAARVTQVGELPYLRAKVTLARVNFFPLLTGPQVGLARLTGLTF